MSMFTSPGFISLLIFLAVVVVSFLVGNRIAKAIRLPDYGWKFGVILLSVLASVVVIARNWPPKLGVDLGGGAILVYRVDEKKTEWRPDKMDALIDSINKRVNLGGTKEITVRSLGTDMVQIVLPAVSGANDAQKKVEADEVKRIIRTAGAMEFRIVATLRKDENLIEKAKGEPGRLVKDSSGKELAKWCLVRKEEGPSLRSNSKIATRDAKDGRIEVLLLSGVNDPYNVEGKNMRDSRAGTDEAGMPEVLFSFNSEGANRLGRLTGEHVPEPDGYTYHMAIVLDDEVQTAPQLQSTISDSGRITGHFTQEEVDTLVRILNAGSLPAALEQEPVRDMTTEATLGADTIRQSTTAMIISSIVVPLFMLVYYRFAGFVAVIVLSMNMLILVALMILVKAPFTLSGLAGLALTVGMAVDNNVLIYERLREELSHGAALRMAIRNSFHRVGVVIIDANITHLLAATVLFAFGTEQVRGFAVTFWLGAVLSIWATMFVAHVFFEVAERRRWVTEIKMMHIIGHTSIDFMGWFPACATFSVLITVLGIAVAMIRGPGLFDIDFTGGVSLQAVFKEKQDIGDVRRLIDSKKETLPDGTVSNVKYQDETAGLRFAIDTSNHDGATVQKTIQELFSGKLVTSEMGFEAPTAIAPKSKPDLKPDLKPDAKPPAKPGVDKSSQWELPSDRLVAMAGDDALLIALADPQTDAKPEVKPEPKADSKAETKPDVKSDAKPDAKVETKPDANPEAKVDVKADVKPETKAEPKPEVKAETKPEPKPEPKPEAKPEAKPETKPEAKAQAKPDTFRSEIFFHASTAASSEGSVTPVKYEKGRVLELVDTALVANGLSKDMLNVELANSDSLSSSDHWTLSLTALGDNTTTITPAKFSAVLNSLQSNVQGLPYFPGVDIVGSAVANDTRFSAIVALVISWILIILYLWIRFQGVAFGLAAVIALIHDVLVMLGAIAFSIYLARIPGMTALTMIEPFKINLQIVAAFLTIIGYSVNDTIVVFDRIREVRGKAQSITRQMVNDATNQTLSRTLLTSLTVIMVVVILYIFGGKEVHGFAFALIIGVLTGTYSSIYVAAPILLWLLHPKEMQVSKSGSLQETR